MTATGPTIALKRCPEKIHPDVRFYEHQTDGVKWLIRRDCFLLADDMGLGKTVQVQVVLAWMRDRKMVGRVLVVCPPTLKENWEEETLDKTMFTCAVLPNTTPKRREKFLEQFVVDGKDMLIVNYEQVVAHQDDLAAMGFDAIILDECHLVKNRKSIRTKAVMALSATIKCRMLLTGSPILNNVDDLWTLLHIIDPLGAPSYWTYRNRYVLFKEFTLRRPHPKTGKMRNVRVKTIIGVKNEAELHQKLKLVMLRREKKDCIDLPEKLPIVYHVAMTPEQRKVYEQAEAGLIDIPGEPDPMEVEAAIVRFGILKAICGTTQAVDPSFDDHSGKLDRAIEVVQELFDAGESLVAFTQHRPVLAAFIRRMMEAGHTDNVFQLHGDVPKKDRQPIIHDWTRLIKAGTPSVIANMYQVGGVGLNMTACNTVMLLDRLFVPKLVDQAIDRVHRIGVDGSKPVTIISFTTKDSIESRIEQINRDKRRIFGIVVDGLSEAEYKRQLVKAVMRH